MTLLDILGKIAWVRQYFLSQGIISEILIRYARKIDIERSSRAKINNRNLRPEHKNVNKRTFKEDISKLYLEVRSLNIGYYIRYEIKVMTKLYIKP